MVSRVLRVRAPMSLTLVLLGVSGCGGCPAITPTDACRQYVDCQAAYDEAAGLDPVDTAAFDSDGSCWSSPELSDRCDAECIDAVDTLATAAAAADLRVEECDPVVADVADEAAGRE